MGFQVASIFGIAEKTPSAPILIWPSVLFLTTTTLMGSWYFHGSSKPPPINIVKTTVSYECYTPGAPDRRSARRLHKAARFAILARFPDSEYFCPRFAGI